VKRFAPLRSSAATLFASLTLLASLGWPTSASAAGRCGAHPWCDTALSPDERASLLLAAMSQNDKIAMLGGMAAPDVDVPGVKFTDGAVGVGGTGQAGEPATAMPCGTALAGTWDGALADRYGGVVGNEVRHHGYDGDFGPTVNIMRTPLGGRTFEAYGEDPFLAARMAVGWVNGLQREGVMADVKHFAANNQEGLLGVPPIFGLLGGRTDTNVHLSDRALHEIELPAFEAAVREASSATVMCSYNLIAGLHACANPHLLQDILRREWGFAGMIVSDAGAAYSNTAGDLEAGLDYDIGLVVQTAYSAPQVELALATGAVSPQTVDARVHEYLRTLFAYGFFDRLAYPDDAATAVDRAGHAAIAQRVAEQAITLLQNDGVLPLDTARVKSIAVIGAAANRYVRGSGSSQVIPYATVDALDGIRARAGSQIAVSFDDGTIPLLAAAGARDADVAIVFAADSESEGTDKLCMSLDCPSIGLPDLGPGLGNAQLTFGDQDGLIDAVAAANPRTVVVLETGAPVLTPWRHRVAALLEAWYPGQDGGTAIARVLFGDVDPGGRLPVTFPERPEDVPTANDIEKYPGIFAPESVTDLNLFQEFYKEDVFVGYRWYDVNDISPAFPFGFGLSYTTFRFSHLRIAGAPPGSSATHEVSVRVKNTGARSGWAVPELYVGLPSLPGVPQPPHQLKGFTKVELTPGEEQTVTMLLDDRSFSYWDGVNQSWSIAAGCDTIRVGASSRDLPLRGVIGQGGARCR
jgi:beta-glucosidase